MKYLVITLVVIVIFLNAQLNGLNNKMNILAVYLYNIGLSPNSELKPFLVCDYNIITKIYLAEDGSVYIPIIAKDREALKRIGLGETKGLEECWADIPKDKNIISINSFLGYYPYRYKK